MILRCKDQNTFDILASTLIRTPSGLWLWCGPIPSREPGDDGWTLREKNRYHPTIGPSGETYTAHPTLDADREWLEEQVAEMVTLGILAEGDVGFVEPDEVERVVSTP